MDANFGIKMYRERWKAIEEIEREELRALSPDGHWKQINSLFQFGSLLGLTHGDDGEKDVFLRWAKLKDIHEQKQVDKLK
ncbi:MAG: hypothetical protein C3F07_10660 [Anaerolineales bacterium]|nr:hypothetical protein [Anaerolineae bacterium]PWB72874.1 MAG: hypothetical protein C3F07_10660 [Anaerolineales bacterium]